MVLKFKEKTNLTKAKRFARSIQKVTLLDLIQNIKCEETKVLLGEDNKPLDSVLRARSYFVRFTFENLSAIKYAFGLKQRDISYILNKVFKTKLVKAIIKLMHKKSKQRTTGKA